MGISNRQLDINNFQTIIITMEQHWMMVLHSVIFGIILYVFMIFGLGQQNEVAERRSILIASVVLIYMILFGHRLPLKLNTI
jgi:hypothetical protein